MIDKLRGERKAGVRRMRFLIAGPGAVGGYVAARLADGGQEVTVLARPAHAARVMIDCQGPDWRPGING